MKHIFGIPEKRSLSAQEIDQVSGGRLFPGDGHSNTPFAGVTPGGNSDSRFTTMAIGEEGGDEHHFTTLALGEEGGGDFTTQAIGEEGGGQFF